MQIIIILESFKDFPPAKLSNTQIIIILKTFEDFLACKIVLTANHQYAENIQGLFCLQNCLRCISSLSGKYSKTFPPAKLSSTQIIIILKIFKNLFACKVILDANYHYPEQIQKFFRLQCFLTRKSTIT